MNLSKKTFLYSAIITTIIVVLMIGYFVLMLPSLYVAYMEEINYNSIKQVQEKFLEEGTYKEISSRNPTATFTLKIPNNENRLLLFNGFGNIQITIDDPILQEAIDKIRYYADNYEELENIDESEEEYFKDVFNYIKELVKIEGLPISIKASSNDNYLDFEEVSYDVDVVDDNTIIFQQDVTDNVNYYTNYIAFSNYKGDIVVTLLPVMTPQLNEIRPIIFQSLPMITATAILIILISTIFFSRKIINPIEKLANHAMFIKGNSNLEISPIEIDGKDEIAKLGEVLNELYEELNKNFKELEEKNKFLKEQNVRQEVFLRASSHQLKTPIAASLLLLESMINEIGKYKDTKEYLPKVKEQLLSIKDIVDSILNLNEDTNGINIDKVSVGELLENALEYHDINIKEKEISIDINLQDVTINTDRSLIYKVIDNLISNAVNYTKCGGDIKVILDQDSLSIINYGGRISNDLLPHIFEPFVSSSTENRGRGLGLYIVTFYCKLLGLKIEINNIKNAVEAKLYLN